jgi:sulfonate transport system permease protein
VRSLRSTPWLSLIVPLLLLLSWLGTTTLYRVFVPSQLPSPGQVLETVGELSTGGELWGHMIASVGRGFFGFVLGAAVALIVGTLVGLSRSMEVIFDPTLQALRNVPSLAWVPFLRLWMGIDEAPKVTLIAIGAFFPVYLNLVSGIRQADRSGKTGAALDGHVPGQ